MNLKWVRFEIIQLQALLRILKDLKGQAAGRMKNPRDHSVRPGATRANGPGTHRPPPPMSIGRRTHRTPTTVGLRATMGQAAGMKLLANIGMKLLANMMPNFNGVRPRACSAS